MLLDLLSDLILNEIYFYIHLGNMRAVNKQYHETYSYGDSGFWRYETLNLKRPDNVFTIYYPQYIANYRRIENDIVYEHYLNVKFMKIQRIDRFSVEIFPIAFDNTMVGENVTIKNGYDIDNRPFLPSAYHSTIKGPWGRYFSIYPLPDDYNPYDNDKHGYYKSLYDIEQRYKNKNKN